MDASQLAVSMVAVLRVVKARTSGELRLDTIHRKPSSDRWEHEGKSCSFDRMHGYQ